MEGSRRILSDGSEILYTVYSDVTEQRRMEQYFQNTLKNLPGGVAVVRYEKMGALSLSIYRKALQLLRGCPWKMPGNCIRRTH